MSSDPDDDKDESSSRLSFFDLDRLDRNHDHNSTTSDALKLPLTGESSEILSSTMPAFPSGSFGFSGSDSDAFTDFGVFGKTSHRGSGTVDRSSQHVAVGGAYDVIGDMMNVHDDSQNTSLPASLSLPVTSGSSGSLSYTVGASCSAHGSTTSSTRQGVEPLRSTALGVDEGSMTPRTLQATEQLSQLSVGDEFDAFLNQEPNWNAMQQSLDALTKTGADCNKYMNAFHQLRAVHNSMLGKLLADRHRSMSGAASLPSPLVRPVHSSAAHARSMSFPSSPSLISPSGRKRTHDQIIPLVTARPFGSPLSPSPLKLGAGLLVGSGVEAGEECVSPDDRRRPVGRRTQQNGPQNKPQNKCKPRVRTPRHGEGSGSDASKIRSMSTPTASETLPSLRRAQTLPVQDDFKQQSKQKRQRASTGSLITSGSLLPSTEVTIRLPVIAHSTSGRPPIVLITVNYEYQRGVVFATVQFLPILPTPDGEYPLHPAIMEPIGLLDDESRRLLLHSFVVSVACRKHPDFPGGYGTLAASFCAPLFEIANVVRSNAALEAANKSGPLPPTIEQMPADSYQVRGYDILRSDESVSTPYMEDPRVLSTLLAHAGNPSGPTRLPGETVRFKNPPVGELNFPGKQALIAQKLHLLRGDRCALPVTPPLVRIPVSHGDVHVKMEKLSSSGSDSCASSYLLPQLQSGGRGLPSYLSPSSHMPSPSPRTSPARGALGGARKSDESSI